MGSMHYRRPERFRCVLLSIAAALTTFYGSMSASATAIYDAKIFASLVIETPAQVNLFGFATFGGIVGTPAIAHSLPASTASAAGGTTRIPMGIRSGSTVMGTAQPPDAPLAFATSFVDTFQKINLGNLSGSGGPTPPAQNVSVEARLDIDFSVLVDEVVPNGNATAAVHVDVVLGTAGLFGFIVELTTPPDAATVGFFTIDFDGIDGPLLVLPPNSVTPLELRTYAIGTAQMTMPPDMPPPPPPNDPPSRIPGIPEPATITLFGIGTLALLGYTWHGGRKRKH